MFALGVFVSLITYSLYFYLLQCMVNSTFREAFEVSKSYNILKEQQKANEET